MTLFPFSSYLTGGLKNIVVPGINSSSIEVKEGAFHLLGSAVQSNPKVQIAAVEAGLVQALIQTLEYNAQVRCVGSFPCCNPSN